METTCTQNFSFSATSINDVAAVTRMAMESTPGFTRRQLAKAALTHLTKKEEEAAA